MLLKGKQTVKTTDLLTPSCPHDVMGNAVIPVMSRPSHAGYLDSLLTLVTWALTAVGSVVPLLSPDGTISSSSILLAQSLQHCVRSQSCSATDLFYQGSSQTVREWLNVAITRTLHQGEDSLLELTKQICSFLQVEV